MASQLDEPFCFDGDVDKSFQLVFPARTVDLIAKDAEEAVLLARGFQVCRRFLTCWVLLYAVAILFFGYVVLLSVSLSRDIQVTIID